jgi:hypothetical protein
MRPNEVKALRPWDFGRASLERAKVAEVSLHANLGNSTPVCG